jgi:very-short-patch-repair endonuclease
MRHTNVHLQVHPVIALHARQMRSALTPSEQKLWEAIRGCRLGVGFRRQVPLGRYIADFVAPSVRLVVEVDGAYHRRRRTADLGRDRVLTRMGYRVLRLQAALVERHIGEAVSCIRAALPP